MQWSSIYTGRWEGLIVDSTAVSIFLVMLVELTNTVFVQYLSIQPIELQILRRLRCLVYSLKILSKVLLPISAKVQPSNRTNANIAEVRQSTSMSYYPLKPESHQLSFTTSVKE